MKVYLLLYEFYGETQVIGTFKSYTRAETAIKRKMKSLNTSKLSYSIWEKIK